jgi:hypothetical protein
MTAIGANAFVNPYYGVNQASGVKPADLIKEQEKAAKDALINGSGIDTSKVKPDAAQEFLDYAKLSVPERIRKQFLESKGLDEKSLAEMSDEERQKIEDEFRELLEAKFKEKMAKDNQEKLEKAAGLRPGMIADIVV